MIPIRDTTPMIPDPFLHSEIRLRLLLLLLALIIGQSTYSLYLLLVDVSCSSYVFSANCSYVISLSSVPLTGGISI